LHVLELKRERTPRDVVAQILDYGSWVAELSHADVLGIFGDYEHDLAFEWRSPTGSVRARQRN